MAYYGNFPVTYPQVYPQLFPQATAQTQINPQPAQQSNNINFVQGEAGAKAYPVAPGQSVLLMDSETSKFFIKSADASGVPLPLRVFEYTEEGKKSPATEEKKSESVDLSMYVTKDEFEAFKQTVVIKKPKKRIEEEDYE